jgi:hypothetical protein
MVGLEGDQVEQLLGMCSGEPHFLKGLSKSSGVSSKMSLGTHRDNYQRWIREAHVRAVGHWYQLG